MKEKYYPKVIEDFVNRNFNLKDRVRVYFKEQWYFGEVVDRYKKTKYEKSDKVPPYIMIKTDEKVDEHPDAYLDGYGIEIDVTSPRVMFADEPFGGNKIYRKTFTRRMTHEEKEEYDNSPF